MALIRNPNGPPLVRSPSAPTPINPAPLVLGLTADTTTVTADDTTHTADES